MSKRRWARVALLGPAALVGVLKVADASAQVKVRSCSDLEAKTSPEAAPGALELQAAEAAVNAAKASLDVKESQRKLQQSARDAALEKPNNSATNIQAAQDDLTAASDARNLANVALKTAEKNLECIRAAYLIARTPRHAVGVGVLAAAAADDTQRLALSLRYHSISIGPASWEFSLEAGRFWMNQDAERDTLVNAMYRWRFGLGQAAFVLGGGVGWLPSDFSEPWRGQEYAVLADLGVEFRLQNKCAVDNGYCLTSWPDLRTFVQPWLPLGDTRVAIMFGVQLGFSVGFDRSSR